MARSQTQGQTSNLEALGRAQFPNLSAAEIMLLRAAPTGDAAFCGPTHLDDDPNNNPASGDTWSKDRQIRADLIRWICVDSHAKKLVDPKGIQIHGARIDDSLDLSHVTVPFALALWNCRLMKVADLESTQIPQLDFAGTWVDSISADGIQVNSYVSLAYKFHAEGPVQFSRAQIGGDLNCEEATFRNSNSPALNAERAVVKGYVFLRRSEVHGEIRLLGIQIGADLECDGATFNNGSDTALDAEGAVIQSDVFLTGKFNCTGAILLLGAQIGGDLDCENATLRNRNGRALDADRAVVKGYVFFRKANVDGKVRLFGTQIGANLECDGATFKNGNDSALDAEGAVVNGDLYLRNKFRAYGGVRLLDVQIAASLDCDDAIFKNGVNDAILGDRAVVKGDIFFRGSEAEGQVSFAEAQIGGDLICEKSSLRGGNDYALSADHAVVRGDILLRNDLMATGEIRLLVANVGGNLDCSDGVFKNGSGYALSGDGATVGREVFLSKSRVEGEVRLLGGQIGGDLVCEGTMLKNPDGSTLNADGLVVKGSVYLREGFSSQGQVRLLGAQIDGDLDCASAALKNGTNDALSMDRAAVKGGVFFSNKFQIEGDVELAGTQIGQNLDCRNGQINGQISAEGAAIKGDLYLVGLTNAADAKIILVDVSVRSFIDDRASWPAPGNLYVDGFVYQRISDGGGRLAWLALQRDFTPQPYQKLAKVLEDEGDDSNAQKVLVEMERLQRASVWSKRSYSWLLRWSIGYGYYPLNALWGLAAFTGLGWIIFRRAYLAGAMTPTDEEAYRVYKQNGGPPSHYPRFSPLIYSLENSLPLVKLGQGDRWQPDPNPPATVPSAGKWWNKLGHSITSPAFLRRFLWVLILLGWVLATLFAAGVGGLVHRG